EHAAADAEDERAVPPHQGREGHLLTIADKAIEQLLIGDGVGFLRRDHFAQASQDDARLCRSYRGHVRPRCGTKGGFTLLEPLASGNRSGIPWPTSLSFTLRRDQFEFGLLAGLDREVLLEDDFVFLPHQPRKDLETVGGAGDQPRQGDASLVVRRDRCLLAS